MTFSRSVYEMVWVDIDEGFRLKEANDDNDPSVWLNLIVHDALDHVEIKRQLGWGKCKFEQELMAVGSYWFRRAEMANTETLITELRDVYQCQGCPTLNETPTTQDEDDLLSAELSALIKMAFGAEAQKRFRLGYSFAKEHYQGLSQYSHNIYLSSVPPRYWGADRNLALELVNGEIEWVIYDQDTKELHG